MLLEHWSGCLVRGYAIPGLHYVMLFAIQVVSGLPPVGCAPALCYQRQWEMPLTLRYGQFGPTP